MLYPTRCLSLCALLALAACSGKTDDSDTGFDSDTNNEDGDTFEEYLVSGTVRGLVNGPVTLEFNGSETVTVDEDGRFSFEEGLLDGDAYEVLVATAPTSQTCAVTAGAGTATTNISDVEVLCECDWQDGLVEVTPGPSTVHGFGQIRYLGESATRGLSTFPAWKQVCGDVTHTVVEAGDPALGDFGDSASILAIFEGGTAHVNGSASAGVAVAAAGGTRGFSDIAFITARPPLWTPELYLASSDSVSGAAVDYVDQYDDNGLGTFAALAGLTDDRRGSGREALLRANAGTVVELHDGEMTIDGVPTCAVDSPQVMPSGVVVATVYGCGNRVRTREGTALFDETGAASLLLQVGGSVGEDLTLNAVSQAVRDDAGNVYVLAATCPEGDDCGSNTEFRSVLRVQVATGAVSVLTDPTMVALPGRRIVNVSRPKVSPGGVFGAVVQTLDADCDGVCVRGEPELVVWDGDWSPVISDSDLGSSYYLRDFDVNDDGDVLFRVEPQFAASQLRGAQPAPIQCWDATSGVTSAMTYGESFGTGTVQSVNSIDLGEAGHWTANVGLTEDRRGIPSYPALVAGTCP